MPVTNGTLSLRHRPDTCQWAVPPAPPQWPAWVDLHEAEWTCTRQRTARQAVIAAQCASCSRWQPRPSAPEDPRV